VNQIVNKIYFILLFSLILFSCTTPQIEEPATLVPEPKIVKEPPKPQQSIQINPAEAEIIGRKIWMNEGLAQAQNLTVWHQDDTFASLGIAHFIWYPMEQKKPAPESFPRFLTFLQQQGIEIPTWLQNRPTCPWNSRREFYNDIDSPQMVSLRHWLEQIISHQTQFLVQVLEKETLPEILAVLPTEKQRLHVREQFYRVAQKPVGIYALIDYINFQGKGLSPTKRYQAQGWGLLQVLENIENSKNVMAAFANAADKVLTARVQNAPQDESYRLPGWRNRLKTYTYEF
jgi:hypothetical protein